MASQGPACGGVEGPSPSPSGPHRSVPPETTLARLQPLLPRLGITRLAVLTGLDVVGIPVAAAYRPNSRSIAVHQGKGRTLAAAKVSALMEAVECFHAEVFDGPLRLGRADEVARHGEVAPVARLPLTGRADPHTARMLWAEARDLATGRPLFVPYELVSADFSAAAPAGCGVFQQTTNGLGTGNELVEAVLQGLYEVVERDAVARWHGLSATEQAACAVDPASVEGAAGTWLLDRLAAARVSVRLWDITAEVGLPAYLALAWDSEGVAGIEPESGAGCHASADIALARALAEAAQARLTRISGARDDFAPASYAVAARAERQDAAERLARTPPARRFRPVAGAATAQADLDNAIASLARAGCPQVACVDLTRADIGIPVARIVVPGLRGPVEEAAA
jgi:YcaO-like protein with predicted kinase domain